MRTHNALDKELQNELKGLPLLHQRKILDIVRLMKRGSAATQKSTTSLISEAAERKHGKALMPSNM